MKTELNPSPTETKLRKQRTFWQATSILAGIGWVLWGMYAEYRIYKIEQAAIEVGVRLLKDRNTALGKLEQYEDIEKK